jgi:hypothetical protein
MFTAYCSGLLRTLVSERDARQPRLGHNYGATDRSGAQLSGPVRCPPGQRGSHSRNSGTRRLHPSALLLQPLSLPSRTGQDSRRGRLWVYQYLSNLTKSSTVFSNSTVVDPSSCSTAYTSLLAVGFTPTRRRWSARSRPEEVRPPVARGVGGELKIPALARHPLDHEAEAVPGVEPVVHQPQLRRVVWHEDAGEGGAEAAAAGLSSLPARAQCSHSWPNSWVTATARAWQRSDGLRSSTGHCGYGRRN